MTGLSLVSFTQQGWAKCGGTSPLSQSWHRKKFQRKANNNEKQTCKSNISTNIRSVQHPKASQNIQHMSPPPPLMSLLEVHLSKYLILLKKLFFSPPQKIYFPHSVWQHSLWDILFFRKSEFFKSLNISGEMASLLVAQNADK